jgi:hypothetical protein
MFAASLPKQDSLRFVDRFGVVNLKRLFAASPRLRLADEIAVQRRFFHWELAFADVFRDHGGFDLTLGNPPWIKVEWNSGGVLGDFAPQFVLRNFTAPQMAKLREETFEQIPELEVAWLAELEESEGTQNFLNALVNYPALVGQKANLFKCFLPRAWNIGSRSGVSGFLHPEGVYDDPNGGLFREAIYRRLRGHYQFHNELNLFAEVHHSTKFSMNVFGRIQEQVSFLNVANLFAPYTLDASFEHDGRGLVPGIKDEVDDDMGGGTRTTWNTHGHALRVVRIDALRLALFASLYDEDGTPPLQARLPALHAEPLLEVLEKFALQSRRLGDLSDQELLFNATHWNEVNAQKDGTIKRETAFVERPAEWVLSGPHFFVANPFYKTPRTKCALSSDYDVVDLTAIPDSYLPRANYVRACTPDEYLTRTPVVSWIEEGESDSRPVTGYYRFVNREMIGPSSERTFIAAIIPPGVNHINTCVGTTFRSEITLLDFFCMAISMPMDYWVKSTGMGHANVSLCWRRPNIDHPCRLNIDQGWRAVHCMVGCG